MKPIRGLWEGVTVQHWLVFLGCWLGGIFDGMDSTLYAVVQHDAIAEVAHTLDRAVISEIGAAVMSVFLLGWVLGGIAFGIIGDKFGRVTAMILSILLYALFTGVAGFAHSPEQLGFCRFLTGFGIGGELVTIATMLSECWPERSRAVAVGSLITSYQTGVFLAGFVPMLVYDHLANLSFLGGFTGWRIVFFVGALPAVLAILIRTQMGESEKWLEARSQSTSNALPLVALFQGGHSRNILIGAGAFGGLLIGYWASLSWIPTWIQDLLGNAITNGTEKTIATQYHGIGAVIGCIASGFLALTIGRRWTIMLSYLGAFLVSAYMFTTNPVFSTAIYWQDGLLGFFIGIAQAIMYVYLPELFPTQIRATAVGFCLNAGRLVTAIAVFFLGTVVAYFGSYALALLAFSFSYLAAIIAGFLGEETRGNVLPN